MELWVYGFMGLWSYGVMEIWRYDGRTGVRKYLHTVGTALTVRKRRSGTATKLGKGVGESVSQGGRGVRQSVSQSVQPGRIRLYNRSRFRGFAFAGLVTTGLAE